MYKSINKIIDASKVNMGGIILDQPLPTKGIDYIDPFLLIHHWKNNYIGGDIQKNVGVGPHPHRGFSPVTFIFEGEVHHRDSRGNSNIVAKGGTQWMKSGMGIVHSERPSKSLAENGGNFEIIQFWVNTPATHKMEQPNYIPLTAENTPSFNFENEKGFCQVISGIQNKVQGKITTPNSLTILKAELLKDGLHTFEIPLSYNTILYLLEGSLILNQNKEISNKQMVIFNQDNVLINIKATKDSKFIILSGEPINEKVSTYGPFVMNTQKEIMEAIRDYQMGKMGVLIEEFE